MNTITSSHTGRDGGRAVRTGATILLALVATVPGAVTNTVPWSDSFESYTNGMVLDGTNGWGVDTAGGALVTSATAVTGLLRDYTNSASRSFPLPAATHTNVLQVSAVLSNNTASVSNGVVQIDFMAMPDWMTVMPVGDTGAKYAFYVSTNGLLTLWHRDTAVNPATNRWTELVASPVIPSNAWARFTIVQDNSNKLFQVRVNEAAALTDVKGWTGPGGVQNGSWFHMVQTNPAMSHLGAAGACAYLDDVVVATRSLSWSGTNFSERVINDGAVDNTTPLVVTLARDTFNAAAGADLVAAGKLSVSGLPASLTAVATVGTGVTNVSITLTGTAMAHEAVNSTNLVFQFADAAFTSGSGWDVSGSQTHTRLAFLDTPSLSYSTNRFGEAAANDGSLDNSAPLVITLTNGTFNATAGEDLGTNPAKLLVQNLPSNLVVEAIVQSSLAQIQVRLLGQATLHESANSLDSLTLEFQDGAFSTVPASSVFNRSAVFSIAFEDGATLTYGTTVFTEPIANNGTVDGTTLSLAKKSFNATNGEDLVGAGKVTVANLPAGLGLQVIRGTTATNATLVFTGAASAHAALNSAGNVGLTFLDAAFVGGNASAVANFDIPYLQINFRDPRILSYSASGFTELAAGLIDNRSPMLVTLSGDTLTGNNGDDFASGKVTVTGLPAGLAAQATRVSASMLSITLTGTALAHASGDSVTGVSFTFTDGAFAAGNAVYVSNYIKTGISVTFIDDTGFFNVVPYTEPFESYSSGMLLSGTNGWRGLNYADACVVTNLPAMTASLLDYQDRHVTFPATGSHTQLLYVSDYIENNIHSEANGLVYLDFMTFPVPLQAEPEADTNMQYAFYISTNRELVVWHRALPANTPQWQVLAEAGVVDTSTWVRFTVAQDYTNNMFQIRVNEGEPVSDAAGWSLPSGGTQPGTWFHMVQTNGTMSLFGMAGVGDGYLDDLTVKLALPRLYGQGLGATYLIR